jgi:hypothetical protein
LPADCCVTVNDVIAPSLAVNVTVVDRWSPVFVDAVNEYTVPEPVFVNQVAAVGIDTDEIVTPVERPDTVTVFAIFS